MSRRFVPLGLLVVSLLPAQHSIVGHVFGADGEPVPAAEVRATHWFEGQELGRATTDGDGMFVLGDVPFALVRVTATAPQRTEGIVCWYGDDPRRRGEVELILWDATTVRGCVADTDGAPIEGAEIVAQLPESRLALATPRTITDARGEFALTAPLGYLIVQAWAPDYGMGSVKLYARAADERADFRLVRGGGVEIRVRYEAAADGGGPEEMKITIRGDGPLPSALAERSVPRGGEWRATGLPDIGYGVFAEAVDHLCEPRSGFAQMGKAPYDFVFRAAPIPLVEMRGRLLDEAGRPLVGEQFVCGVGFTTRYDALLVTDEEGGFRLPPVMPGSWRTLRLVDVDRVLVSTPEAEVLGSADSANGGGARSKRLRPKPRVASGCTVDIAPDGMLDLRAVPAQRLRGKVVQEGHPLARADVWLDDGTRAGVNTREHRVTAEDGSYVFDGLCVQPDTELRVRVEKGAWFGEATFACVGDCAEVVVSAIEMQRAGVITGEVRDSDGRPLPGARVSVRDEREGQPIEVLTDRRGRYCFRAVRPGRQSLTFVIAGRGTVGDRVLPFEIKAGERVSEDFRVP